MSLLITLDIDGTITDHHSGLSKAAIDCFYRLYEQGARLAFITGRSFHWGHQVLHALDIPYFFAIHNGAIIMEMPSRKIVAKKYLDPAIFPALDEICRDEPSDYAVYGGFEYDDICYYRPDKFDPDLLFYLQKRIAKYQEDWRPINDYRELPIESFASVKCFGKKDSAQRMAAKIVNRLQLHAPMIRDPFDSGYYVVQATHPEVDKGEALLTLKSFIPECEIVIAGGDDLNDVPMLEKADISIGMATAPEDVLSIVDITAPPASEEGIIQGLQQAVKKASKNEVP